MYVAVSCYSVIKDQFEFVIKLSQFIIKLLRFEIKNQMRFVINFCNIL